MSKIEPGTEGTAYWSTKSEDDRREQLGDIELSLEREPSDAARQQLAERFARQVYAAARAQLCTKGTADIEGVKAIGVKLFHVERALKLAPAVATIIRPLRAEVRALLLRSIDADAKRLLDAHGKELPAYLMLDVKAIRAALASRDPDALATATNNLASDTRRWADSQNTDSHSQNAAKIGAIIGAILGGLALLLLLALAIATSGGVAAAGFAVIAGFLAAAGLGAGAGAGIGYGIGRGVGAIADAVSPRPEHQAKVLLDRIEAADSMPETEHDDDKRAFERFSADASVSKPLALRAPEGGLRLRTIG